MSVPPDWQPESWREQQSTQPMKINPQFVNVTVKHSVLRAKFVGPAVGQREAPIITEDVRAMIDRHGKSLRAVIVDLSDIRMLSSMGLGTCIDIRNRALRVKAKPILFGLQPDIAQLFSMMRIERLYAIANSEDDLRNLAA